MLGLAELPGPATPGLLAALRGLVDTSLVVADTTGPVARCRMLDVIRAYALARLAEAGESELVRDRHLDLRLAAAAALAPLLETDRDRWRAATAAEYPDIRAAVEWGLSRPDPARGRRLAVATAWLWHLDDRGVEGLRLLRRAAELGAAERTPLQAEVLAALALVADTATPGGDPDAARAARDLAAEVDAPAAGRLARSLAAIGDIGVDLDVAAAQALQARDEARATGDGFVADASGALLGLIALLRDRYREAAEHLEPAVAGLLRRGDRSVASSGLAWLALAAARSGDLARAGDLAEQAVRTAEPLRELHRMGAAAAVLAEVRCRQVRADAAAAALASIDRLVERAGRPPNVPGWGRR